MIILHYTTAIASVNLELKEYERLLQLIDLVFVSTYLSYYNFVLIASPPAH